MAERQRTERRIHITPYRPTPWEPFQDWTFPATTIWDQDFGGMPMTNSVRSEHRQRLVRGGGDPWASSATASVPYVVRSPAAVQPTAPQLVNRQNSGGVSQVSTVDGKYQILLDVKHFLPEEITVKTVGDTVEIKGSHDEKQDDHGVISRDFTRKYTLPKDVDPMTVSSFLSSDGFLTVEAPLNKPAIDEGPKPLPVQHESAKS
uniref:alpha-crystallin A chain-like n=1 Tax=Styela clava TaxID=7725 RepID=UPI0019394802|nr:alpha-crystallin A chain-like [Styela clava]